MPPNKISNMALEVLEQYGVDPTGEIPSNVKNQIVKRAKLLEAAASPGIRTTMKKLPRYNSGRMLFPPVPSGKVSSALRKAAFTERNLQEAKKNRYNSHPLHNTLLQPPSRRLPIGGRHTNRRHVHRHRHTTRRR